VNPAQPGPLEILQTPAGALSLAIAALLGVLGLRLMGAALGQGRPGRATLAAIGWGASLPLVWAGGHRLLPGAAPEAPLWLRVVGAGLLLVGLLLAGRARSAAAGASSRMVRVAGGLSLVLAGQVARAPSAGGAVAAGVAMAALLWAAAGAPGGRPERMDH
jgi:hypothetical protein